MAEETKNSEHYVLTDIKDILNIEMYYGYWRTYLFNEISENYDPIYDEFIFYKGKFFDSLESKPWSDEQIEQVQLLSNYFNRNGTPICVFKFERSL